ncbi:MAG: M90 family metallopeptidase [bacterium]
MGVLIVGFVLAFVIVAVTIGKPILQNARRQTLMLQPFPPAYEKILEDKVFIYRHLTPALQIRLKQLMNVFLDEKHFEGCDGIEITDEIRVTIAAEACLLMLHGEPHFYPALSSILVYPHPYLVDTDESVGQEHVEATEMRAGESWLRGSVVLAWDLVEREAGGHGDGRGVALHEFAHQLDQEDGRADGAPVLGRLSRFESWAMVLGNEYQKLKEEIANGQESTLDEYGATNPAEFFAVATEAFFRNPIGMKSQHSSLYDKLKEYFRVDPAEWISKDSTLRTSDGTERVVVRPLKRVGDCSG